MKTNVLNFFLLFFVIPVIPVFSQPVLTQSGISSLIGDSVNYGRQGTIAPITDIQGPNVTWYFTYDTTVLSPSIKITKDPVNTPFPTAFPLSNRCTLGYRPGLAKTYTYRNVDGGLVEVMGTISDKNPIMPDTTYVYYEDYKTTLQFPVHYGDSLMDQFSGFRILASNDTNQQHGSRYFKADSYGTLIYSTGDTISDVMRVYSVEYDIDSMLLSYDSTTHYSKVWYKEGIRTPLIIQEVNILWRYYYQTQTYFSVAGANYRCLDPAYINDYVLSGCYAAFSANPSTLCEGDSVAFTDLSFSTNGVPITWQWSFEGGTPATSTAQNPVITYDNDGDYDVQLIVSDSIYTDTLLQADFIHVQSIPESPGTVTGPTDICQGYQYNYTITGVPYATGYNWQVIPVDAGTFSGDSTSVTFQASTSWTGAFDIQVSAEGLCGTSPFSAPLTCALHNNPILFQLTGSGNGGYCEGDPGSELTLDNSETGMDYELYLDGSTTGIIVAGTGSPVSFGFLNTQGIYTAIGTNGFCTGTMYGQVYVHQWDIPGQAGTPAGNEETCDNDSNVYTTEEIEGADWYEWTLDPAQAGVLAPDADSVTISWNSGFSGSASLSVHGENDCGTGPESDPLDIMVSLAPDPLISGPQSVYPGSEEQYQTAENPGNTYSWEVTGGTITAGGETHQVTVMWGGPGEGSLTVTEGSTAGCYGITYPYGVVIDESIAIEENHTGNVHIYPNPSVTQITVEIPNSLQKNAFLTIYDLNSRHLLTRRITEQKTVVDVTGLPDGIYIVKLVDDSTVMVEKVVKK